MDCSLPGSSVHGTIEAKILEWIAKFLPPEDPPDQRSNTCLLHWNEDSLPLSHLGSPTILPSRIFYQHSWNCDYLSLPLGGVSTKNHKDHQLQSSAKGEDKFFSHWVCRIKFCFPCQKLTFADDTKYKKKVSKSCIPVTINDFKMLNSRVFEPGFKRKVTAQRSFKASSRASPVARLVKKPPAMQETPV